MRCSVHTAFGQFIMFRMTEALETKWNLHEWNLNSPLPEDALSWFYTPQFNLITVKMFQSMRKNSMKITLWFNKPSHQFSPSPNMWNDKNTVYRSPGHMPTVWRDSQSREMHGLLFLHPAQACRVGCGLPSKYTNPSRPCLASQIKYG